MIALTARKDWLATIPLRDELGAGVEIETRARLDPRALAADGAVAVGRSSAVFPAVAEILAEVPLAASYVRIGPAIGAQAIINLRSFEELAREFAGDRSDARLGIIRRRHRAPNSRPTDDPQEPELELDGVRILTVHQAKGLEWPTSSLPVRPEA